MFQLFAKSGKTLEPFDHHRGKLPLLRPTSQRRTQIFLTVNFLGFILVNAFWLYVATGAWTNFSLDSYHQSLFTPLGEIFLEPLSVLDHHWMIFVFGLLLAVIIFMPIMVAVMYRLVYAIALSALVVVLGHSPALGLTLTLGCFLAARTPLRSDMPFLAFLLGLLPVAAYLTLLAFAGVDPAALPFERLLVKAPLVLAIVLAVMSAVIVLTLARIMGYRPGSAWPVMALLLAVPMALFFANDGPAAMRSSILLGTMRMPGLLGEMPLSTWQSQHHAQDLSGQALRDRVVEAFREERLQIHRDCRSYLGRYPNSPASGTILYLQAEALSLQVDQRALDAGVVRFTSEYPDADTKKNWQALADSHSQPPQAALAHWRLAQLALRDAELDEATKQLQTARKALRAVLEKPKDASTPAQAVHLQWPRQEAYEQALQDVDRLAWMIDRNNLQNDPAAVRLLAAWLKLDPNSPRADEYLQSLMDLAYQARQTVLKDNLVLAVAMATPDLDRRVNLLQMIAAQQDTDASVEANFQLGLLAMQVQAPDGDSPTTAPTTRPVLPPLQEAVKYFQAVHNAGQTPWSVSADSWLSILQPHEEKE